MFELTPMFGLILGFIFMGIGMILGGSGVGVYWNLPSIMITIGGACCATAVQYAWKELRRFPTLTRKVFVREQHSPLQLIADLVRFAEIARRDGILALEGFSEEIQDPFLKRGLQLAVDGTDPELIQDMLATELDNINERHSKGKKIMENLAANMPAFGMIGTLLGLVAMLVNLDNPKIIGPSMAVALLTTLYGAVASYLVFGPMARKLEDKSKDEELIKNMIIQGVMSIQSGDNPRIVEQKLRIYLPPELRLVKK